MTFKSCVLAGAAMHLGVLMGASAMAQSVDAPLVTRDDAILHALQHAPETAAADARTRSREARADDARLRPNPRLSVEIENFGGSGPYGLLERAESTVSVSQRYERGGDLAARSQFAESEVQVSLAEARVIELDLVEQVELAYLDVQMARARLELIGERRAALEEINAIVDRRVRAARDPRLARDRVQAWLAEAEIDRQSAREAITAARAYLASFWNGIDGLRVQPARFDLAEFDEPALPASSETAEERMALAHRSRAEAEISRQVARATSDIDVGLQARHFQNGNEVAVGLRVSVPLQLRNTNRHLIASARSDLEVADRLLASVRRSTDRERRSLDLRSARTLAEIEQIDSVLLPQLERSLTGARDGYQRGTATYLEILDAQRALTAARERRIAAFADLYQTHIRLRRLAGQMPVQTAR